MMEEQMENIIGNSSSSNSLNSESINGDQQSITDKREARRRKILENSKNRLAKISGRKDVIDNDEEIKTSRIIYPDPEVEREEIVHNQQNHLPRTFPSDFDQSMFNAFGSATTPDQIFSQLFGDIAGGGGGGGVGGVGGFAGGFAGGINSPNGGTSGLSSNPFFEQLFSQQQNSSNPQQQSQTMEPTKLSRFFRSKIQFSLLALITYALVTSETMISSNIFVLFLTWELAEVFILKRYEQQKTSLLAILLLLGGIPTIHSTLIIRWIETIHKILKDVAIYMFFFVTIHIIWQRIMFVELPLENEEIIQNGYSTDLNNNDGIGHEQFMSNEQFY